MKEPEDLDALRRMIADVDEKIVSEIARRMKISEAIGRLKARRGLPIEDAAVEREVVRRAVDRAAEEGLDAKIVRSVFNLLIRHSKEIQRRQFPAEDSDTGT